MATLVKAITAGSFNGSRVRAGKEFVLPDGMKPGKWLEVIRELPSKPQAEAKADATAEATAKAAAKAAADAEQNAALRNLKPAAKASASKSAEDLA